MARKKVVSDFHAGDSVTPKADLLLQVHDASDDSIIPTANYAAIGSVNTPGTDGANFVASLVGSVITLDGVDLGDPLPSSIKIRCKDADGMESPLSDAFQTRALLLFKTDFEGTVVLSPDTGGNIYQYFSGSSLGYTFPTDGQLGLGTSGNGIHLTGALYEPSHYDVSLKTVIGHLGIPTTVLHQRIIQTLGVEQTPWQFNNATNNPDEFYMSWWMKMDADLFDNVNDGWRALFEYKTKDWVLQEKKGARLIVNAIVQNNIEYWRMDLDYGPGYVENNIWREEIQLPNGLPKDEWFKFEVYFKWGEVDTGHVRVKINGETILERANCETTVWNTTDLQYDPFLFTMSPQLYSSWSGIRGKEQWINDLEVWEGDPNVTFISTESVTIEPATDAIYTEETSQLNATVLPSNADNKSGHWTSSDETIATVDDTGLVTGIDAGAATITFTTTDGSFSDTSAITVSYNLGPELIINGIFDTDLSGWNDTTGATWISDYGGSCRLTRIISSTTIAQNSTVESGKNYILTFDIKENNGVVLCEYYNGAIYASIGTVVVGSYSINYTALGIAFIFRIRDNNTDAVFDNISVKEIL